MTDLELRDAVFELTDAGPCSFAAQHEARRLARAWGPNGPYIVSEMIDQSCIVSGMIGHCRLYYENPDVGLFRECPLQDWHDFAKAWRGPWEGYG